MREILEVFGQVAGIGGLALGVLLFVFKDVIKKIIIPIFSEQTAYRLLRLILILVSFVTLAGIAAWTYVAVTGPTPTTNVPEEFSGSPLYDYERKATLREATEMEVDKPEDGTDVPVR